MLVKRSIVWTERHPVMVSLVVTGYMMFRSIIKRISN